MSTFKTSSISITSVLLSSSDVIGLHSTPVNILPAPGSGLAYVVLSVLWEYNYNTTDFDNGGTFSVATKTANNANMEWAVLSSNVLYSKGHSTMAIESNNAPGQVTSALSDFDNQPVVVGSTNAATVGDGSIKVTVVYATVET
jgi:hypothetical protein